MNTLNLSYNELGSKTKEWFQRNFDIIVCDVGNCTPDITFDNLFGPDSNTTFLEAMMVDDGYNAAGDTYKNYDLPGRRLRGAAVYVNKQPYKVYGPEAGNNDGNLDVVPPAPSPAPSPAAAAAATATQIGPTNKDGQFIHDLKTSAKHPTPDYTYIGFNYFAALNLNFQMKFKPNIGRPGDACTNDNNCEQGKCVENTCIVNQTPCKNPWLISIIVGVVLIIIIIVLVILLVIKKNTVKQ